LIKNLSIYMLKCEGGQAQLHLPALFTTTGSDTENLKQQIPNWRL